MGQGAGTRGQGERDIWASWVEVRGIRHKEQGQGNRGPKPGLCHVTLRAALMDVKVWGKDRTE